MQYTKKRDSDKNSQKASRQASGLGRRDLMKFGAGLALAGILKVPEAFGQEGQPPQNTIYAPSGYAETTPPVTTDQQASQDTVYVCPMDPDIRSNEPGVCPRCGMTLVAGIPDYTAEYRVDLKVTPRAPKPGETAKLDFTVFDPYRNRPVKNFQVVHEKLYHLFVVSQGLEYFLHDHPTPNPDGTFTLNTVFPKAGMYRLLSDIYPTGGTPQLIAKTVFVPGTPPEPVAIPVDFSPKDTENMHVELASDPGQPVAGLKTILKCHVGPVDGFEQLLGAWAHLLVASDDLVDMIHTHPTIADGGPDLQFNLIFPRARTYRLWLQFQRKGVINTAHFDIAVSSLG